MKKAILTLVVLVVGAVSYAQDKNAPQRLKYITTGPDGSVAVTIYDDTREDSMKLESANNFYRYEILDQNTGEAVFESKNKGKECNIDKSKIASGTYKLRLYTANFVITSEVAINNTKKVHLLVEPTGEVIASL